MRTTVTLDADVEAIIRERMARKQVGFKRALNDAVRDGAAGRADYVFTQRTVELGLKVDGVKINELSADLEDAELVAKMGRGA